jgi:hypothetical protein
VRPGAGGDGEDLGTGDGRKRWGEAKQDLFALL